MVNFIKQAQGETEILRIHGAWESARARDRVIHQFMDAASAWLDTALSVEEAAKEFKCSEETVRRSIRDGRIPDRRAGKRGHHSVRRRDAQVLDSRRRKAYDAVADAQDIAKIRRGA
jgi:excisionase family DNA binding protein